MLQLKSMFALSMLGALVVAGTTACSGTDDTVVATDEGLNGTLADPSGESSPSGESGSRGDDDATGTTGDKESDDGRPSGGDDGPSGEPSDEKPDVDRPVPPDGKRDCAITCGSCGEPLPNGATTLCAPPTKEQLCLAETATCERQADGQCGYTRTKDSERCGETEPGKPCEVVCSGCSEPLPPGVSVLCAEPTELEMCIARTANCERQGDGTCGFSRTEESKKCADIEPKEECEIVCTGCSEPLPPGVEVACAEPTEQQLCIAKTAKCERQANGQCGYTRTEESKQCGEEPRPECAVVCSACTEPLRGDATPVCARPTAEQACIAKTAKCERQDTGECGFTRTEASKECAPSDTRRCEVVCSSCSEPLPPGVAVSCLPPTDTELCLMKTATCERQDNGVCAFTETAESKACGTTGRAPIDSAGR